MSLCVYRLAYPGALADLELYLWLCVTTINSVGLNSRKFTIDLFT